MKFYAILCMGFMTIYLVFAPPTHKMTQNGAFSSDFCQTRPSENPSQPEFYKAWDLNQHYPSSAETLDPLACFARPPHVPLLREYLGPQRHNTCHCSLPQVLSCNGVSHAGRGPTEGPSWGYPRFVLGAIGSCEWGSIAKS